MIRTQLRITIDLVSAKITTVFPHANNSEVEPKARNEFGLMAPTALQSVDQDLAEIDLSSSQNQATLKLALTIMKTVSNQLLTLSDELVEIRLLESTGNPKHTWNINMKKQTNAATR